jgi:hypothetical protein
MGAIKGVSSFGHSAQKNIAWDRFPGKSTFVRKTDGAGKATSSKYVRFSGFTKQLRCIKFMMQRIGIEVVAVAKRRSEVRETKKVRCDPPRGVAEPRKSASLDLSPVRFR